MKLKLQLLSFLLFSFASAFSQWKNNGPYGGIIAALHTTGDTVYCGTRGAGIYKSTDGINWTDLNQSIGYKYVSAFTHDGKTIYAATYYGDPYIYKSQNGGKTWTLIGGVLNSDYDVNSILVHNSDVYITAKGNRVFVLKEGASSWEAINTGLPEVDANALAALKDTVYVATDGGIYKSHDKGANWQLINGGLSAGVEVAKAIISDGTKLYAAFNAKGIFSLTTGASDWIPFNTGLLLSNFYNTLYLDGNTLTAASSNGGMYQTNTGTIGWMNKVSNSTPINTVTKLGANYILGNNSGIYFYNSGITSKNITGIHNMSINKITAYNNKLYAVTGLGLFTSEDEGNSWQFVNNKWGQDIIVTATTKYISADEGPATSIYQETSPGNYTLWGKSSFPGGSISISNNGKLFYSADGLYTKISGTTLTKITNGLTNINFASPVQLINDSLYIITDKGIFLSKDDGISWTSSTNYDVATLGSPIALKIINKIMYVGIYGKVYRSSDLGKTWQTIYTALNNNYINLISSESNLYISENDIYYRYLANEECWNKIPAGPASSYVNTFYASQNKLFMGYLFTGLYTMPIADIPANKLQCKTTSIESDGINAIDQLLDIAPNPFQSNTKVIINTSPSETYEVSIIDLMGREIEKISGINGSKEFLLGEKYSPGMYKIILMSSDKVVSKTIIKK